MNLEELMKTTSELGASDIHLTVGVPPVMRIYGELKKYGEKPLMPEDTLGLVKQLVNETQIKVLEEQGEIDISYSQSKLGRFRVNIFKQRGSYGIAIRIVALRIPSMEELGLPPIVKELAMRKRGLVLITGPTGSGKSTTLASIIDYINNDRSCHILTLEDPIEYLHKHNKSIVNQREIGNDCKNFAYALRSALRQDPDVILVGEMRDLETISIAITAAETGHLVLSTLHTIGAAKTIDRVIDVFPPYQQQQVRIQLAAVLEGVISQQLLPKNGGGRIAAMETMIGTTAIRNLIREGKTHQIQTIVQTGSKFGMKTMDMSISELFRRGIISRETALSYGVDRNMIDRYLGI
ncbi:MAG: type IV pilus twitching motility protein PilT [Marinisporobacter sp.]|jgi:twitching motility protein PilT|nr:type IV pilus twitching motility protein PilT [Marinisporobacter sp.]